MDSRRCVRIAELAVESAIIGPAAGVAVLDLDPPARQQLVEDRMDDVGSSGSPTARDEDMDDLRVTVESRGRAIVLAVAGELDMLTANQLQQTIESALESHPPLLIVDLSKVEFMASAGMNVLLAAKEAAGSTTQLRLVATGNVTLRPLQITGLIDYLAVFKSLDAALRES